MTSLVLDIPSPSVQTGDTTQIDISATYQDGHTGPLPIDLVYPPSLTSSNSGIATVDATGSLKALSPGQTVITVTAAPHTATMVVAVTPPYNIAQTAKGCTATDNSHRTPNTIMVELKRGYDTEDAATLTRQNGATLLPQNSPTGHFIQFPCTPGDTSSQMQKLTERIANIKADHRVKEATPVTITAPKTQATQETSTPTPEISTAAVAAEPTPECAQVAHISTDPQVIELTPGIPRTLDQVTLHCTDRTNVILNPAHPDLTYSTEETQPPIQAGPQGRIAANRNTPTSNHIIIITHRSNRHRLPAHIRARHTNQNIETGYCTPDNHHTAKLLVELTQDITPTPTNPDLKRLASRAKAEIDFTIHPNAVTPLHERLTAAVFTVSCATPNHLLDQLHRLETHPHVLQAQPYLPLRGDAPGLTYTLTTHQKHITLKTGDSILINTAAHYPNGTQRFLTAPQVDELTLEITPPDSARIQASNSRLTALKPGNSLLTIGSNDPNTNNQTHSIPLKIVP